jgi:hypothetical protein
MGRIPDLLGSNIENFRIPRLVYAEADQGAHVCQPERLSGPDRDLVKVIANHGGEDRLPGQMKMDFRQRPVGLQRRVEGIESAGVPSAC